MEDRFKLNHELQQKYNTNQQFRNKMIQKQNNFKTAKAALAKNQQLHINQQLLQIFSLQSQYDIFFYYGYLQPKQKKMTTFLTLFLIKNFNPRFHKKYKFVFFNNCVDSNQIYYEFKNIFLRLPIQYFLALDQFIFLKPSISQKVSQWWVGQQLQKYFKAKSRYINSTAQLCPILDTGLSKLIEFLPRRIIQAQYPEQLNKLPQKQNQLLNHRINLQGQSRTAQQRKKFDNFVLMMGNFFQNSKNQALQLNQYQANQTKLPVILQELFLYFDQNPQKIKQEGLFRKSVSIDEQNETLEQLMRSNFDYLKKITNSHLIANLIKRFFAKLKTPIFPYRNFQKLMHDQGVSDKLGLISWQINQLPQKNYFTLMALFQFLIEKVLPYQKYTKMNANNLAICFAPCLLKSQVPSQLDLIYATKSSHVVKMILDNFEQIFGTKYERNKKLKQLIQQQRNRWDDQLTTQIKSISQGQSKSQKSLSSL